MRISLTKTDESLERDGTWVGIRYGIEVLVARMGNPRAEAWRANLSPEDRKILDRVKSYVEAPQFYERQIKRAGEIMRDCIAETVLLGWRNIEDDEGEGIPFSVENAKALLTEYDWFYEDVQEAATTRETFFRAEVQETGNSSRKSSAGSADTESG